MEPQGAQAAWTSLTRVLADASARVPDWVAGIGVLLAAVAGALACHALLRHLAQRALGPRRIFLASLVAQTRGPTRLALTIVALSAALPWTRLDAQATALARHGPLIA